MWFDKPSLPRIRCCFEKSHDGFRHVKLRAVMMVKKTEDAHSIDGWLEGCGEESSLHSNN